MLVPHTHWDREWYLPERRLRQRLVGVVDDVLDALEADDELVFLLDGQTAILGDHLLVRPEARDRVARLVEAGRLVIGPWYVLADELLAGDEPLTRNLLVGRDVAAGLGGWLGVGYSPDAFGHPAALPLILAGFGIGSAVIWRGYGSRARDDEEGEEGEESGKGDLFWWEAPDGSRILTHHLPPEGYELGVELPAADDALRARWDRIREVLAARATVPVWYVPNGADHHTLQPDLTRVVARLRRLYPDDVFVIGSPADYFDAAQPLSSAAAVPLVQGELRRSAGYTWSLQGVHATRAGVKRAIAAAGTLLQRYAEPAAALAATDRRALLRVAWREHLLTLSHDVIGGCCADPVAEDARLHARHVVEQAHGILEDALDERLGQDRTAARRHPERWDPHLAIVNPSPAAFSGVVEVTVTVKRADVTVGRPGRSTVAAASAPVLTTHEGRRVSAQLLYAYDAYERLDAPRDYPDQDLVRAYRLAVAVEDVPALGLQTLRVAGRRGPSAGRQVPGVGVRGQAGRLEGDGLSITAGRPGGFRIDVPGRAVWDGVGLVASERDAGDAYTFEPVTGDVPVRAHWGNPRVVWPGPLVAVLARDFALGDRALGTVFVRLDAGASLVRLTVEGVNRSGDHRLRLQIPVRNDTGVTIADMLYGPTVRAPLQAPVHRSVGPPARPPAASFEAPVATAPMHRYVSAGGVTVFARGCFEYELLPGGVLAITLLRAVGQLSRGELRARPGHAGWPVATPDAQEPGPFRAELAVAPIGIEPGAAPYRWSEVEALAERFHAAPAGRMLRWGIAVPPRVDGPALAGEGLTFKAVKPREAGHGVVLRCVNLTGEVCPGRWTWPTPLSRAYRARLDETVLEELPLHEGRRQVRFDAEPREVVTIVVEP